ncbi:MAG: hypothetical protein NTV30_08965, partial [Chloroflexi bacterium]|nr:hypothetical protein [Chloroflexota bacterium]
MKVLNNFKGLVIISSLMLVIGACGKQGTSILGGNQYNNATCSTTSTTNTFTGTIQDTYDPQYGYSQGTVALTILSNSGAVSGQFSASAVLTLNGSQYCCTTQGAGNVLLSPMAQDEVAIVNGLTLICNQSTTGNTGGLFNGTYQAITLKIGVSGPGYENGYAYLLIGQTLQGYITVSSGVQLVGGIGNMV